MQVMEGDHCTTLQKHLPRCARPLAIIPGRNEPGTGEINYPLLFRHLDQIGYRAGSVANTSREPPPLKALDG